MSHNTAIFAAACLSLSLITAPAFAANSSNKVLTVSSSVGGGGQATGCVEMASKARMTTVVTVFRPT